MLEPCEGKLSCTVLRGEGGSNTADLLDQLIENKQKFISQIMTSKSPVRSCEDVDEAVLTFAEVKALATDNPYIREKMELDVQVSKLKLMKANHTSQKYRLEDNITKHYPQQIVMLKERVSGLQADIRMMQGNLQQAGCTPGTGISLSDKERFSMKVGDRTYTDKKEAGTALVEICREMKAVNVPAVVGEYVGFKMSVSFDLFNHVFVMNLKGQLSHNLEIGADPLGNLARINHALESMPKELSEAQTKLATVEHQMETAKVEVQKPFAQESELTEKLERLSALNALLNMDEKGNEAVSLEDGSEEDGGEPEALGKQTEPDGTHGGGKPEQEEQAADEPMRYPVENARHNPMVDRGNPRGFKLAASMADRPAERPSLKERLERFKAQAAEMDGLSAHRVKGKEAAKESCCINLVNG